MRYMLMLISALFLFTINVHAAVYEWKDDKGVVNFTDNPENIPAKYRKRAKQRPSISVEGQESQPPQNTGESSQAVETPPMNQGQALYGGHDENWWRSRFNSLRDELKSIQDGLPAKNSELEAAHRKMTIYGYSRYRTAYYDLLADIEKDNNRIKELNKQLESLENEASRAAVPSGWRQ